MPGWAVAPPAQQNGGPNAGSAVLSRNGGEKANRPEGVRSSVPPSATLSTSSQPMSSSSSATTNITRTASHPVPSTTAGASKENTQPRRASPSTGIIGSTATHQDNSTPPPTSIAPDFTPFSPSQTQNLIASLRKGAPLTASSIAIARNGSPTAATAPSAATTSAAIAPPASSAPLQANTSASGTPTPAQSTPSEAAEAQASERMDIDTDPSGVVAASGDAVKESGMKGSTSIAETARVPQADALRQLSASPDIQAIENPNPVQTSITAPTLPVQAASAMTNTGSSSGGSKNAAPSSHRPAPTQQSYGFTGSQPNNLFSQAAVHAAADRIRQQQVALHSAQAMHDSLQGTPDAANCTCAGCARARKPPSPTKTVTSVQRQAMHQQMMHYQAMQNAAASSAPQGQSPHADQATLPGGQTVQQVPRQSLHNAQAGPSAPLHSGHIQQNQMPNGTGVAPLPSPTGSNQQQSLSSFANELQDIQNTMSRNMQLTWNALFQPMESVRKRIEQVGTTQNARIAELERQLAQAGVNQNAQTVASLRQQISQKNAQVAELETRLRGHAAVSERDRRAAIAAAQTSSAQTHNAATESLKAQHEMAIREAITQTVDRVRKEHAALPKSDDVKAVEEKYKGMLARRIQKMAELQAERDKAVGEKDMVIADLQAKLASGKPLGTQARVVILEEQLRKSEDEKMNLEDDLAQAQSKLQIYSTMPSSSSGSSSTSTAKLQADLADAQADIDRLTAEVQTARDSNATLQKQLDLVQKERDEKNTQLAKVGSDIATIANHVSVVRKNLGMDELPQGTKLAPKIMATLQAMSDRIKEKIAEDATSQAEVTTMTKTITSSESKLADTSRLLAEMESSKHKVEKELETVRANATAQVQLAETRIANTDQEVEKLKEEMKRMGVEHSAKVKGLKEELEAVRKSLKEKEVEVLENVERVKVLAEQLEVAEVAKETSPSAIEEWEKVKAEMASEIEELKRTIVKLEKAKTKMVEGTTTAIEPVSTPQSSTMRRIESSPSAAKTKTDSSISPSVPRITEPTQIPAPSAISSPSKSSILATASPLSSLSSRTSLAAPQPSARSATPSTSDDSRPRSNIIVTPTVPRLKTKETDKPAPSTPAKPAVPAMATSDSARKGVAKIIKSGSSGSPSRRTPEVVIPVGRASPSASTSSSASKGGHSKHEAIDLTGDEAAEAVLGPSMNRKMKRKKPIKEPLFMSDEDEEEEPTEDKEPEAKKQKQDDKGHADSVPAPKERETAVTQPVPPPPQASSIHQPPTSSTPVTSKPVAPPSIKREWVETQLKALTCKSRDGKSTVCKMCITEIKDQDERKRVHESDRRPIPDQTHKGIMDHLMTHTVTLRRYRKKRQREGKEPATP